MKGGAEYSDDRAPPFSKDMSPVYLVLPPTKDLLLVRVEDMETGGGQIQAKFDGWRVLVNQRWKSDRPAELEVQYRRTAFLRSSRWNEALSSTGEWKI
jgi:hypothetical protein